MARSSARANFRWLLLAVGVVVVAIGAFALWIFVIHPRTWTDIGPLDLPGIPPSPATDEQVLLGVGDIGWCGGDADERVAQLAADLPGTIAMLGDDVYPEGTAANYAQCLAPSWGPMLGRTRPAIGNHDYVRGDASAYFSFFGSSAGTDGEGWYSYDLGAWHVVVLNSNCGIVGCDAGSPQMSWLESDLSAHPSACLLAYWHHPRWSSGRHGSNAFMDPLWSRLVDAGVDVVLNGHDHSYEHVAADGVDEFVVGTGGRSLYRFESDPLPQTVVRHERSYGLFYLALGDGTFRWEFLPVGATTFADSGSGSCS
jgi:hypothetical protein